MTLKSWQTAISLATLYKVNQKGSPNGTYNQVNPNMFVDSGSVDVYIYNGATEPTGTGDMVLDDANTGIGGCRAFQVIPEYIYLVQNAGASTEIILSGLEVEDLGGF